MKRITAFALFCLATLVTAGSVSAQDHTVQSTIPFDFTVGNTLLPAGTYTISSDTAHVVVIRNAAKHIQIANLSYPSGEVSKKRELVFHKYGDQYFLSEIECSAAEMNMKLPTSKLEKRVHLQEASVRNDSQVYLALK